MQRGEKNLKDSQDTLKDNNLASISTQVFGISLGSYKKANKLITALYMVTDIIDDREPIRVKLRTLGGDILSDMYSLSAFSSSSGAVRLGSKVSEVIAFLDIATTMNIISQMNVNILKKEFSILQKYVEESIQNSHPARNEFDLANFLKEELITPNIIPQKNSTRVKRIRSTRIGVQRGGTLMKALSDKASTLSDMESIYSGIVLNNSKDERRKEILEIITNNKDETDMFGGSTITDIRNKSKGHLSEMSEKTLQRELVAMVKDNVLEKTGSKRWSRYSLPKSIPNQPSQV